MSAEIRSELMADAGCTCCSIFVGTCLGCLENARNAEVIKMALQVKNNRQFRRILKDAKPALRQAVYDQLAPLMSFKVKPYLLLKP